MQLLKQITLFDMSTVILNNTFKTTSPLINAIVNKTLQQLFPLSDYWLLQFFHCVKFSSVVESLLKGPLKQHCLKD